MIRAASLTISIALVSGLAMTLIACGAVKSVDGGAGGTSATDPEKNKPLPTDFSGLPGAFGGQWSGACTYVKDDVRYTNCSATLSLKQDGMSTYLMGTLQYTIGYLTAAPVAIHRFDIDVNSLSANGRQMGKIGKGAFEFYDDTMGDFSAKLSGDRSLGLNIAQLPDVTSLNCNSGFCFSAALSRTGN